MPMTETPYLLLDSVGRRCILARLERARAGPANAAVAPWAAGRKTGVLAGACAESQQIGRMRRHNQQRKKGTVDSVVIILEAFKVTLRGFCLDKGVCILRYLRATLDLLELQLKRIESERVEAPSADVVGRLRETLTEFQETAEREVLFKGKYAWAHSYGEGERPGMGCGSGGLLYVDFYRGLRCIYCKLNKQKEMCLVL
ncbi:hypothetical protein NDU88_001081 [Pleurodeles waltl]|uniref:Uncharacterized protein n=1 Tax=Pleurodeles waltl TaxID=8319 RepID=A0AAV7VVF4_PLEWA|nr:hypothetical protein NDU88_001081 [Pleurodeles waltl]